MNAGLNGTTAIAMNRWLTARLPPYPGRDYDQTKDPFPKDGVVLGGFLTEEEAWEEVNTQDATSGPLRREVEYVTGEFLARIDRKLKLATGEPVWLRRPEFAQEDGRVFRSDALQPGKQTFYLRAYFAAPGVFPSLMENGPIEFVRAPGA